MGALCYSDFGSEYDIESLSEPVKKTLSKFDSDNVKEHWCKYGNWVLMNKNSFRGGSGLFYKGDVHERHLSKQKKEFELLDGMRKGKDVTDTETDASMENKNIKYNISKKVINFRLWNFRTSKVEDMDTIIYRKIKNDEKADIYILSNEDMTIIIPSKLFMYNKKYFKQMSDGINISIPFSRCKAIWIRDISDETDTSQKRDINEHYEKYLEAIGPH